MFNVKYWAARIIHDCVIHPMLPFADMLDEMGVRSPVRVLDALAARLSEIEFQAIYNNLPDTHHGGGNVVPEDSDYFRDEDGCDADGFVATPDIFTGIPIPSGVGHISDDLELIPPEDSEAEYNTPEAIEDSCYDLDDTIRKFLDGKKRGN